MKVFKNMKIRAKILTGFILIALIAGVIGVIGVKNIKSIDNVDTQMYVENTKPLEDISDIAIEYQRMRVTMRDVILAKSNEERDNNIEEIKNIDNHINEKLSEFSKKIKTEEGIKEYEKINKQMEIYRPIRQMIIELVVEGKNDEALMLMRGEAAVHSKEIRTSINKVFNMEVKAAEKKVMENTKLAEQSIRNVLCLMIVGITISVILGIIISNFISKPIKKTTEVAKKLSKGDINVELTRNSKDEIGQLTYAFKELIENTKKQFKILEEIDNGNLNVDIKFQSEKDVLNIKLKEMADRLKELIGEISYTLTEMSKGNLNVSIDREYKGQFKEVRKSINIILVSFNRVLGDINGSAEQVSAAAKQVSNSSQELSQGAAEQASSVEEITASMSQIAAQTKQNAENASTANHLAMKTSENAKQGNDRMKEMLTAMNQINDASKNISKIIKVIDEIAFQTNILALNAAVEAARAGQHGKGFAVVAEEVRNLAGRSANAAKETTTMIEDSIKKVKIGTEIANETAQSLDKIVNDVNMAAKLVADIANASNEQATAISQMNQAIDEVSNVTQMNTATAQESASASEELLSQAVVLKDRIEKFNLKESNLKGDIKYNERDYIDNVEKESKYHEKDISKIKISLDDDYGKY
ncbi:methyl-accepting chemotaxis protein [Clostridium aestuarii]|uniref:Methyl-accepting chemotaxis protein n=1 Tax=Clostridium aestuarii TaxID=338193 RepID=A0ABT4D0P2_9CLOT|nr:methyl-accepting chemotaxis protein [Clostridium aestuarii]MCY6484811.1 methyl-accepting chemotaxis protein [Clostridium aestuarii]